MNNKNIYASAVQTEVSLDRVALWTTAAREAKDYCKQKRREAYAAKDSFAEWIWAAREQAWLDAESTCFSLPSNKL